MATGKIVYYNGGTQKWRYSSEPDVLSQNRAYKVVSERDLGTQTNYTLEGVKGEFNSVWFDEVFGTKLMVANKMPRIGMEFECTRLYTCAGKPILKRGQIGMVVAIQQLADRLYLVTTKRDVYVMQYISE